MKHWKRSYGGIIKQRPDFSKCAHEVVVSLKWNESHQCSKPCGHGDGGAYCKIHSKITDQ